MKTDVLDISASIRETNSSKALSACKRNYSLTKDWCCQSNDIAAVYQQKNSHTKIYLIPHAASCYSQ